jgi:hypothetical protein
MTVKPDSKVERDETAYHSRDGVTEGVVWFDPEMGQIIEADIKQDVNVDKNAAADPKESPGAAGPGQTITT